MESARISRLELAKAGNAGAGTKRTSYQILAEDYVAAYPKKGRELRAKICFWDESGISERPSVRKTWAPRGKTPIIRSTGSWKIRSVVGMIAATPSGRKPKLHLRILKKTVRSETVIRTVTMLRRHIRGKLILIWDGLPAHRSKITKTFLKTQSSWLMVKRFPAYAPELNPVEYIWAAVKRKDVANFCPDTLQELDKQIRRSAKRLRQNAGTLTGFLNASKLFH